MPPNMVQSGLLETPCECGEVHDQVQGPGHVRGTSWRGIGWGYPKARDKGLATTVDDWLEDRRRLDAAEGLWRIEDNLYDLTLFMDRHPGGKEWLQLTKGMDVTEVFFTHHISETAEALLPKFLVRPAASPRNSPFTFHRDGFFMQLRERARKALDDTPKQVLEEAKQRSKTIIDTLAVSTLLACGLAAYCRSFFLLGTLAGLLLSLTASAAHNFFHQKNNWRRYYFELSFMSSREWRVSHALSHHIFPNTLQDLEVTFFEPVIAFLPYPGKNVAVRYLSWVYSLALYSTLAHGQLGKRLLHMRLQWVDAVALAVPGSMLLAGAPLWDAWLLWTWVLLVSSLYFAAQGLSAGHHHPDNFHEGDALGLDSDFGLMQLATTPSCTGVRGRFSLWLSITHFGDHRLHHMFPALDHAVLPLLAATFDEHLAQYHLPTGPNMSAWEAFRGKYLQMARNRPNPRPAGSQH